jgi:hypothetical protein
MVHVNQPSGIDISLPELLAEMLCEVEVFVSVMAVHERAINEHGKTDKERERNDK